MRRRPLDKKELPYRIYQSKPWFFWEKCGECGFEVRRETIYKIDIGWYTKKFSNDIGGRIRSDGLSIDHYNFCSECCGSLIDAENLFIVKYLPLYR